MKLYLTILSVVFGVLGAASAIPALFSVMLFDAPGSTENPATIALVAAIATCPIVCPAAVVGAWLFYRAGRNALAAIVIWSPILNVVVAAIAIYCLETFYGGKFNG